MTDYSELIKNLRHVEQGYAEKHYGVGEVRVCDMAKDCADALEALTAQLSESQRRERAARNELCLKCGRYRDAHNGACDECRWKEKHEN